MERAHFFIGLGLALNWLPLVGLIWVFDLRMPILGFAAWAVGALAVACVVYEQRARVK